MLRLNLELLRLFANGTLPTTAAQRLAHAAKEDGWGSTTSSLKGFGAQGEWVLTQGMCNAT